MFGAGLEAFDSPARRQQTIVKQVLISVVGESQPVIGIGHELLMYPLRIAVLEEVSAWIRACSIRHTLRHNVFGVVNGVTESFFTGAVADAEPVVDPCVAEKVRNRCIAVAVVEDHHHVIDKVVNIKQDRVAGISRAVDFEPLGTVIVLMACESQHGYIPKLLPGIKGAVSGLNSIAGVWSCSFYTVPIVSVTAEI